MNKYCTYLYKRSKNYKPVFYCKYYKRYINYSIDCQSCLNRNVVTNKPIKTKTNKLKKLEDNRYSIFTDNLNECYYCHKKNCRLDLHEIYGGSNRIRSMKNGLVLPLCRECHSNEEIIAKLRITCQKQYEKSHTREEFIELIGKNYIKED